jgi:hypothetical protein
MKQSSSWKANIPSAGPPLSSTKPEVIYSIPNSPPLAPILCQMNPSTPHILYLKAFLILFFLKIFFNSSVPLGIYGRLWSVNYEASHLFRPSFTFSITYIEICPSASVFLTLDLCSSLIFTELHNVE